MHWRARIHHYCLHQKNSTGRISPRKHSKTFPNTPEHLQNLANTTNTPRYMQTLTNIPQNSRIPSKTTLFLPAAHFSSVFVGQLKEIRILWCNCAPYYMHIFILAHGTRIDTSSPSSNPLLWQRLAWAAICSASLRRDHVNLFKMMLWILYFIFHGSKYGLLRNKLWCVYEHVLRCGAARPPARPRAQADKKNHIYIYTHIECWFSNAFIKSSQFHRTGV